jgi:hypothetical protein
MTTAEIVDHEFYVFRYKLIFSHRTDAYPSSFACRALSSPRLTASSRAMGLSRAALVPSRLCIIESESQRQPGDVIRPGVTLGTARLRIRRESAGARGHLAGPPGLSRRLARLRLSRAEPSRPRLRRVGSLPMALRRRHQIRRQDNRWPDCRATGAPAPSLHLRCDAEASRDSETRLRVTESVAPGLVESPQHESTAPSADTQN